MNFLNNVLHFMLLYKVADFATVPALLELDPRSFRGLSPERVCDFYCGCVYYSTVNYFPL